MRWNSKNNFDEIFWKIILKNLQSLQTWTESRKKFIKTFNLKNHRDCYEFLFLPFFDWKMIKLMGLLAS